MVRQKRLALAGISKNQLVRFLSARSNILASTKKSQRGRFSLIPRRVSTPSALPGRRLSIRPGWILLPTRAMSGSRISSLGRRWPTAPVPSLPGRRPLGILRLRLCGISVRARRSRWRLSIGPRSWSAVLIRGRRRVAVVLLIRLGRTQVIVCGSSGGRMIGLAVPIRPIGSG